MPKFKDLTGKRFGRWTVIRRSKNNKYCRATWLCICDCGIRRTVVSESLTSKQSTSCGCGRKGPKRWPRTLLEKEAKKYKTKKEFRKNSSSAYQTAKHQGILDEICKHMIHLGNKFKRALYAFEYPDKSVYVGLTYDYDKRYYTHMTENDILIRKRKQGGQLFRKFNVWYSKDIVGQKETELIEKYRKNGWTILNKAKPGGLGGGCIIWTEELCIKEAKKYKTRSEWQKKSGSSYIRAHRMGWFKKCIAHMGLRKWPNKPVICLEKNKKFKSIKEAGEFFNMSPNNICSMLKGKQTHAGGFTFKYI